MLTATLNYVLVIFVSGQYFTDFKLSKVGNIAREAEAKIFSLL